MANNAFSGRTQVRSGLIPDQPLMDRRNQPMPFLYWVDVENVGPRANFLTASVFQLLTTFHAICQSYGLQMEPQHFNRADFIEACLRTEGCMQVRVPKLYLLGKGTGERYVCFDWAIWMKSAFGNGSTQ